MTDEGAARLMDAILDNLRNGNATDLWVVECRRPSGRLPPYIGEALSRQEAIDSALLHCRLVDGVLTCDV